MKGLIAFSIIIIFVNCQYCVRNESMTLTLNSESHYIQERLFHNDVIDDSLESFIKDVGPDSYSNTVYTIDFAKYKSDTLISFMAYKHVREILPIFLLIHGLCIGGKTIIIC